MDPALTGPSHTDQLGCKALHSSSPSNAASCWGVGPPSSSRPFRCPAAPSRACAASRSSAASSSQTSSATAARRFLSTASAAATCREIVRWWLRGSCGTTACEQASAAQHDRRQSGVGSTDQGNRQRRRRAHDVPLLQCSQKDEQCALIQPSNGSTPAPYCFTCNSTHPPTHPSTYLFLMCARLRCLQQLRLVVTHRL